MAAFNYAALATTAQRLIADFGRNMTLTVSSSTPADAAKPWRSSVAAGTSVIAKGIVYPLVMAETAHSGEKEAYSRDLLHDGVRRGDMQALFAADDLGAIDPKLIDSLADGASIWHVISAQPIAPGDVTIVWSFHLRE